MSFQWIFDNAEKISVSNREIVGQTISRNGTVRATSRGSAGTTFTIQLPDGMPWEAIASEIQAIENANKFTVETVAFTNTGYTDWIHNGMLTPGQTWDVICTTMPQWTIFQRNQVSWSGSFVFNENLV